MELRILGLPGSFAQEEHGTNTEEHAAEEEHNPIIPELGELIPGALAFLIVFLVLQRFAFPAIRKGLKERQDKIQGDLEEAERAKSDAQGSLQRYEEQLQEARTEAGRIIEEARKTAEQMRKDMATQAQEEAQQIVRRAQEEVRGERDRALQSLRRELAEASVELAGRVVGESLDRDRQMRLVDQYIDDVVGMRSNGNGNGNGSGG